MFPPTLNAGSGLGAGGRGQPELLLKSYLAGIKHPEAGGRREKEEACL